MGGTKINQTLNALNKVEKSRFIKFLQSPYFNQRQDVLQLYQAIGLENVSDDKESLYARACPGAPFDPQKLRLLLSYLQKLADQFLALEQWMATPGAQESALVQASRQKGLERHFQDALQLAQHRLSQQPLRNSEYYIRQGMLLWEEARYASLRHPEDESYLIALSDNADLLWLSQKLRYLCLHTAYSARFRTSGSLGLRETVEAVLQQADYMAVPAISTWYYCLKMLESPESAGYFARFKQQFLAQSQAFDPDELRDLYLFAVNYCIRRVNEGQTTFFHDIMDFYKEGLTQGHLLDKGVLSHFTYYNIVAAGLHTREYEWVEHFIQRYRNALERSYRDSAYSFNRARLEFARKRYDDALALLQNANYHDPLLNMAAKTMALKIYYALDEYEVLHAHLEAFIIYIRRKPGLGYHRNNYLNLARYTQKLIALNWNDKAEVSAMRQKIENEAVLTEREWLLEQFARS
ncbi:MAG: hypothetical protein JNL02_08900 [Saprospiraceae bacterium]|nr:hypothetical protein [Saprospiraceae bacterium]